MKIFISYKFEGEDLKSLEEMLLNVKRILEKNGNTVFTTLFEGKKLKSNKEIMDKALNHINESDSQLIIINSAEKSEGLLLEAGYSIAKNKKIILAVKKGIQTKWLKDYAYQKVEFETLEDLYKQLEKVK